MLQTSNLSLQQVVDANNGQYPKYSSIGVYPMVYLDQASNVICPDCANNEEDTDTIIFNYDANWEDDSLYCDICSQRVESAYGDNEE